jgi:hypothetical protein
MTTEKACMHINKQTRSGMKKKENRKEEAKKINKPKTRHE